MLFCLLGVQQLRFLFLLFCKLINIRQDCEESNKEMDNSYFCFMTNLGMNKLQDVIFVYLFEIYTQIVNALLVPETFSQVVPLISKSFTWLPSEDENFQ